MGKNAATDLCAFCHERFTISRHSNQRGAIGGRMQKHRFCSPAHRLAAYRRRQRKQRETQASTPLAASVSSAPKRIENKGENWLPKTTEHRWKVVAGPSLSDRQLRLATIDGLRTLRALAAANSTPSHPFKVRAAHISASAYVIEAEIRRL